MANQYHPTFFNCSLRVDVQSSIHFYDLDRIILPCNYYLAFNFNLSRVLRLNQAHDEPVDVTLADNESGWRLILRDRFLESGPSFIRDLVSRMGVTTPNAVHSMATDISSFVLLQLVGQPLYSRLKVLTFSLDVTAVTSYDEQRELERVMVESAMPDFSRTIPTAPSFIEAVLKKVNDVAEINLAEESCTICLEEFSSSTEDDNDILGKVVSVPCCSHLFHKDCIVRWLETSHLCPLCRYAMPTAS